MRGIFISYRRDDAEGQAGRLFDDLSAHFGRDAVFMDVAGIKKGLDFRRIIDEHVTSCGVLLVMIGKRWLSATDSKGKRRLDDPNDFVRLETAAALSRDIPVVPVLVHDAVMPTEQELPDVLKELAFRNGTELTHARWDSDVKLLIEDLRPYLETAATAAQSRREPSPVATEAGTSSGSRRPNSRSLWAAGSAAVLVGGVSILGYHLWQDRPFAPAPNLAAAAGQIPPAIEAQRRPFNTAVTQLATAKPTAKIADEPAEFDPTAAQAEAAKAAAAKAAAARAAAAKAAAAKASAEAAARAEAARRDAEEQRRREDAERAMQLAEEQRRRDQEARRIAQEQAEKNKIAAEQAAGAKLFAEFATAIIGSKQNNRR
jgi:flagellar biosynthesis GTPase FlhF